jgi:hypothetical protein
MQIPIQKRWGEFSIFHQGVHPVTTDGKILNKWSILVFMHKKTSSLKGIEKGKILKILNKWFWGFLIRHIWKEKKIKIARF